jgi:hypothetical protein
LTKPDSSQIGPCRGQGVHPVRYTSGAGTCANRCPLKGNVSQRGMSCS